MFKYIKRKMKESKMREIERHFEVEDMLKEMLIDKRYYSVTEIVQELLEENVRQREELYIYFEKYVGKEKK